MPFFESASGVNIHGGTFHDHGSGNKTINNNQRYNTYVPGTQSIIHNDAPLQDDGLPISNYHGRYITWQQTESGQTPRITDRRSYSSGGDPYLGPGSYSGPYHPESAIDPAQLPRYTSTNRTPSSWRPEQHLPTSPSPHYSLPSYSPHQIHSNQTYTTSSLPNPGCHRGAPETILEDAEFWSEEPAEMGSEINPFVLEPRLVQRPMTYPRGDQTMSTPHAGQPNTSLPSAVNVDSPLLNRANTGVRKGTRPTTPAQNIWSAPQTPPPSSRITTNSRHPHSGHSGLPPNARPEQTISRDPPDPPRRLQPLPIPVDQYYNQPDPLSLSNSSGSSASSYSASKEKEEKEGSSVTDTIFPACSTTTATTPSAGSPTSPTLISVDKMGGTTSPAPATALNTPPSLGDVLPAHPNQLPPAPLDIFAGLKPLVEHFAPPVEKRMGKRNRFKQALGITTK